MFILFDATQLQYIFILENYNIINIFVLYLFRLTKVLSLRCCIYILLYNNLNINTIF